MSGQCSHILADIVPSCAQLMSLFEAVRVARLLSNNLTVLVTTVVVAVALTDTNRHNISPRAQAYLIIIYLQQIC